MATSAEYWTTTFSGSNGETNAAYEFLSGRSPSRYQLIRLLKKKGMREMGEIISTLLTDSSPSTSASVTISELTAEADTGDNVQGGARTIASKEQMGLTITSDKDDASANTARAVSAGDVTNLQEDLVTSGDRWNRAPTNGSGTITYPTDASGNGGGGKFE